MFTRAPFLGQVPLRPPSLGCGGMMILPQEEEVRPQETPSGMLGCEAHRPNHIEGCSKCRKKKRRDWTLKDQGAPSGMISMRGRVLGDARHSHALGQTCPLPGSAADPANFGPDVACQLTASGDVICSNNIIYSGSCPHAPKPNVSGVAGNIPGTNVPQAPPPLTAAAVSTPAAPGAPAAPAAPASSPIPVAGIAVGGIAVLGLAYLLFR